MLKYVCGGVVLGKKIQLPHPSRLGSQLFHVLCVVVWAQSRLALVREKPRDVDCRSSETWLYRFASVGLAR